jgi:hypothetical protein
MRSHQRTRGSRRGECGLLRSLTPNRMPHPFVTISQTTFVILLLLTSTVVATVRNTVTNAKYLSLSSSLTYPILPNLPLLDAVADNVGRSAKKQRKMHDDGDSGDRSSAKIPRNSANNADDAVREILTSRALGAVIYTVVQGNLKIN